MCVCVCVFVCVYRAHVSYIVPVLTLHRVRSYFYEFNEWELGKCKIRFKRIYAVLLYEKYVRKSDLVEMECRPRGCAAVLLIPFEEA